MAGAIQGSLCSGWRENTRELVGKNERGPSTREKKACGRNRALEQACRRPTSERERNRKPQLARPHRCHLPPPPAKPCGCVLFPPHEQLPPLVKFREERPTSRSHLQAMARNVHLRAAAASQSMLANRRELWRR